MEALSIEKRWVLQQEGLGGRDVLISLVQPCTDDLANDFILMQLHLSSIRAYWSDKRFRRLVPKLRKRGIYGRKLPQLLHCRLPFCWDAGLQGINLMVCASISHNPYAGHRQTRQREKAVENRPPGKTEHSKEGDAQREKSEPGANKGQVGPSLSQCGADI